MEKLFLNKKFDLSTKDGRRALILVVGIALLYYGQTLIPGWNIPEVLKVAISTLITSVINSLTTPTQVITEYTSDTKAESVVKEIELKSNIKAS